MKNQRISAESRQMWWALKPKYLNHRRYSFSLKRTDVSPQKTRRTHEQWAVQVQQNQHQTCESHQNKSRQGAFLQAQQNQRQSKEAQHNHYPTWQAQQQQCQTRESHQNKLKQGRGTFSGWTEPKAIHRSPLPVWPYITEIHKKNIPSSLSVG